MQCDPIHQAVSDIDAKTDVDGLRELIGWLDQQQQQQNDALADQVHTQLGSTLTALTMRLALLTRQVSSTDAMPDLTSHWDKVHLLLTAITETTRDIQRTLRPFAVESLGFVASLSDFVQQFGQRTGIASTTTVTGTAPELAMPVAQGLLKIIASALRNVEQHAHASNVDLHMACSAEYCVLVITDNGLGFDTEHLDWNQTHGLRLMRERALLHRAHLNIISSTGRGCSINIELPL